MKTNFLVPRMCLELHKFAGMDPTRTHLSWIEYSLEKKQGGSVIHAVSCDGARLLHANWLALKTDVLPKEPIYASAKKVGALLSHHGKEKKDGKVIKEKTLKGRQFEISEDGGNWRLSSTAGYTEEVGSITEEVSYPPWKQVIPRPLHGDAQGDGMFGVELSYLVDFQRYLAKDGCNGVVRFERNGKFDPIRMTPESRGHTISPDRFDRENDVNVEYVLMLVRLP